MPVEKVVIENVRIVDGYKDEIGNVTIKDDKIHSVQFGTVSANRTPTDLSSNTQIIDGRDLLLTPGFIDMHAHSAITLFDHPKLEAKIESGYTTDLICPDGLGPAPVRPASQSARRQYLTALETGSAPWDWEFFKDYLVSVSAAQPSVNIAGCVPHSALRDYVMGGDARPANKHEIRSIAELAEQSLEEGGVAISFGLIYAPGLYAETEELLALGDVAAKYDVPLIPHIRNEADLVLDSINEFISISKRTGAKLHLSHLKIIGNAHLLDQLQDLIVTAADETDLTFDQYPYGAGSTLLSALLPKYFFEGGPEKMLLRLQDSHERLRMAKDMNQGVPGWENIYGNVGPENIDVTQTSAGFEGYVGKTIAEISDQENKSPEEVIFDLLLDCQLNVAMIDHYSEENTVRSIFATPNGMVGTDGVFNPHPHPRLHGTSSRVLGRYALQENIVPVQEAVARLSTWPAERLGLHDRGRIDEGFQADLVLLDPKRFIDRATYENPNTPPEGVSKVFVNGHLAFNETHSETRLGRVLRRAAS